MNLKSIIGLILTTIAVILLADLSGIFHWDWLLSQPWVQYIGAFAVLILGLTWLFDDLIDDHDRCVNRPVPEVEKGKRPRMSVICGGDDYTYQGQHFYGAELDATFGGLRLDLRDAIIDHDVQIDVHTAMGGVEIFVPSNVNVVVKSSSFMGGVGNDTRRNPADSRCINVRVSNFMGGVTIRN